MFHSQFDLGSAGGRDSWDTALRLAAEKGGRVWIAEGGEVVAQLTLTSALAGDAAAEAAGRFRCGRCGQWMALDDLDILACDNEVVIPSCRDAAACSRRRGGGPWPPLPSRLRCPGCGRRQDKRYRDGRTCTCVAGTA